MDTTIIYYTANVEEEVFAKKIRDVIWQNRNGLPIISVSRKPIDFGTNICVGEVPWCVASAWRQIYLGLQAAKTRFALAAEADTLYPPEYFNFLPGEENQMYRYDNIWIFYTWPSRRYHDRFWRKSSQMEGAQICGCKYWIRMMEKAMDVNNWEDTIDPPILFPPKVHRWYTWKSDNPVLTIKTGKSLFRYTTRSIVPAIELPYWGTVENVRKNIASEENSWIHFPTS